VSSPDCVCVWGGGGCWPFRACMLRRLYVGAHRVNACMAGMLVCLHKGGGGEGRSTYRWLLLLPPVL
jgi:hypothetical protein